MKFYSKLKVYKASNVMFDPETMIATSYKWWEFVKVIRGRVVFNAYQYSSTTSQHQMKVRSLLESLDINIDVEIHAPSGLQEPHSAIDYYEREIKDLQSAINKPGSKTATNMRRANEIDKLKKQIAVVVRLVGTDRNAYHDWAINSNIQRLRRSA
jgi:hypothetical protein